VAEKADKSERRCVLTRYDCPWCARAFRGSKRERRGIHMMTVLRVLFERGRRGHWPYCSSERSASCVCLPLLVQPPPSPSCLFSPSQPVLLVGDVLDAERDNTVPIDEHLSAIHRARSRGNGGRRGRRNSRSRSRRVHGRVGHSRDHRRRLCSLRRVALSRQEGKRRPEVTRGWIHAGELNIGRIRRSCHLGNPHG